VKTSAIALLTLAVALRGSVFAQTSSDVPYVGPRLQSRSRRFAARGRRPRPARSSGPRLAYAPRPELFSWVVFKRTHRHFWRRCRPLASANTKARRGAWAPPTRPREENGRRISSRDQVAPAAVVRYIQTAPRSCWPRPKSCFCAPARAFQSLGLALAELSRLREPHAGAAGKHYARQSKNVEDRAAVLRDQAARGATLNSTAGLSPALSQEVHPPPPHRARIWVMAAGCLEGCADTPPLSAVTSRSIRSRSMGVNS